MEAGAQTAIRAGDQQAAVMARPYLLRIDPVMLLAVIGLVICSIVTIAGATADDIPGNSNYYVVRQIIYAIVGGILMFALAQFDYTRLKQARKFIYGFLIGSILLVLALGGATRGSRRWIEFPFFTFQPSELGKLLLIVVLAAVVADQARNLKDRSTARKVLLLGAIPAVLVILQPDLGTGLVYVVITLATLFFAGLPWQRFAAIGAAIVAIAVIVLALAPAAGINVLKPYQVDRLTAFVNPSDNPSDEGYQQNQSRIAIGAGQRAGRGDRATQTRLNFLPEHHTDFIFAVVGESYGFVGAGFVLSLYALLIWRGLRTVTEARDLFGTLLAGGVISMLLFQIFVNIGMTVGIMPITGVPLPLMSYGGSSVLVTFMAIGVLQSVHARSRIANRPGATV